MCLWKIVFSIVDFLTLCSDTSWCLGQVEFCHSLITTVLLWIELSYSFYADIASNAEKQTLSLPLYNLVNFSWRSKPTPSQRKSFMWTFLNSGNTKTIKKESASKDSTLETVDRFSPLLFQRLLLPPLGLSRWPCLMLDAQTKGRALPRQPARRRSAASPRSAERQPTGHGRLKAGRK